MTREKARYGKLVAAKARKRERDEVALKEIDYGKLRRKLRIVDNDRKTYAREVNHILRKQR